MIPFLLVAIASTTTSPRTYHAWLETPGGDLGFGLELIPTSDDGWQAFLVNGEERIAVPHVVFDGREMLLDMPHYDSRIRAHVVPSIHVKGPEGQDLVVGSNGDCLEGEWEKRRSETQTAHVPFRA